ncbi:ABC transporter permease [Halosimplex sp. J119]
MSDQTASPVRSLEEEYDGATNVSRLDRWRTQIDLWLIAPARIMWEDTRTRLGALIVLFYVLMGTVGVVLTDPPTQNEGEPLIGMFPGGIVPSGETPWISAGQTAIGGATVPWPEFYFPLGTDLMGNSLLEMTVHATPAMLKMAFAGGVVTTLIGTAVGTVAGYKGGRTERVLITAADIQMAIPGLPLLIVLAVALQPRDPLLVGFLLSVDAWAGLARQLHSQVLSLRNESYVEASRLMGFSSPPIIWDDVLPNIMPYVMINFMGNSIRVIHASVGLYFLGVLPFTTLNWGVMINMAYNEGGLLTWNAAHWLLIPIVAIGLLGFGITLFSQGMDRLFNPKVRARYASSIDTDGSDAMNR